MAAYRAALFLCVLFGFNPMTQTIASPVVSTPEAAPVVAHVAGFIPETQAPQQAKAQPLFLSLDAAKVAGTPLYTIDGEGARTYLPASFVGQLLSICVIEKDYSGSYEAQTKLVTRLSIGDSTYALHVGLNSWAGQSLLTSLAQLTENQLHQPLLLRMVAGRRTCFCRVSVGSDERGWNSIAVEQNFLSSRMEAEDLMLLASSIDELLAN